MSGSALLVVDLLEDFFRDQPLQGRRSELIAATNSLLGIARARQIPVVWIRQEFAPDLSDAYLEMRRRGIGVTIAGTAGAQVLAELEQQPEDAVVVKKRYSAFFGTGVDSNLERWNVRRLILAGVNTHACIRMTAIDAYQRDLDVTLAVECIASYDQQHHEVSLRYMSGRIARRMSNAEIDRMLAEVPEADHA